MKLNKRNRLADSLTPPTSARRSTRVSRTSTGGNATASTSSRRKTNRHQKLFTASSSDKPARKWAKVLRPPRPGVGFKTLKWVPVDQLTMVERNVYDEEELEKRRKKDTEATVVMRSKEGGQEKGVGEGQKSGEHVDLYGPEASLPPPSPSSQKEVIPTKEVLATKEAAVATSTESEPNTLADEDVSSGAVLQKEEEQTFMDVDQEASQKEARTREVATTTTIKDGEVSTESHPDAAVVGSAEKDVSSEEVLQKGEVGEYNNSRAETGIPRQTNESDEMERFAKKARIDEGSQQTTTPSQEPN